MGQLYAMKLKVELPFLKKGSVFCFDDDTGEVYRVDKKVVAESPLRFSLANYLWLLKTDGKKYLAPTRMSAVHHLWKTRGE